MLLRISCCTQELSPGRDIALRCPRPRNSGRNRCAAARGADGAARRPYQREWFMASIHVQFGEVFPTQELCARRAAILAAGSAPKKFGAEHLGGRDAARTGRLEARPTCLPRSWPRFTSEFWRCSLPMNRLLRDDLREVSFAQTFVAYATKVCTGPERAAPKTFGARH